MFFIGQFGCRDHGSDLLNKVVAKDVKGSRCSVYIGIMGEAPKINCLGICVGTPPMASYVRKRNTFVLHIIKQPVMLIQVTEGP